MTCVAGFLRRLRIGVAALLPLLAAGPAWAQTVPAGEGQQPTPGHWQVRLAVGEVNWRSLPTTADGDSWRPVKPGAILAPPAEIQIAANGRIELWRGEDRIQAGADTRLTLEDSPQDLITLIRQAAGAVWYKVKSVTGRKFEVEGRYLVATVKGTEFRIVLGEQGDLLRVMEGVVKATPRGGGESLDVAAGQWVLANASGLLLLVPPGGEPAGPAPSPAPPEPEPPGPETSPTREGATGDVHGVNGGEQHNHGGTKGGDVRDTHGDPKSDNGSGANAKGPK